MAKKSDELLGRTNRFFQDKIVQDRAAADDRHEKTKLGLERRLEMTKMTGDDRANKLMAANTREEATLKEFYDKTSEAQRGNYENSLRELRDTNKRDQDAIFQNFTKQSTERETKFQSQLTEVNTRFEAQIQALKEEHSKAMTNQIAVSSKEKKSITDQKNSELQRQAAQYENRLAKLTETHKREVDNINRRHEESINGIQRKGRS
mgnify:CR=1 FL=1